MRDIPFVLFLSDPYGQNTTKEIMEYLFFEPMLLQASYDEVKKSLNVEIIRLELRMCNVTTDFGIHKQMFEDPSKQVPVGAGVCLNP